MKKVQTVKKMVKSIGSLLKILDRILILHQNFEFVYFIRLLKLGHRMKVVQLIKQ